MLTTDRERKICERFSRRGDDGLVQCSKCPLVKDLYYCICKGNSHYNRKMKAWVFDDLEVQE